jgi:hypothetical protein
LLGALVPETPALALRIGLDVEMWLDQGLLDLMSTGWGYRPCNQKVEQMIALGHQYGVPVYPNINASALLDKTGHVVERLRGMASNCFAKGADGVYLFNLFSPVQHKLAPAEEVYGALKEIGDPRTLKAKDKLFGMIPAVKFPHGAYSSTRSPLPVGIVEEAPLDFFVGDDVPEEERAGNVREVRLVTRVTGIDSDEEVMLLVNGSPSREATRRVTEEPFVAQYPWYWNDEKGGMIIEYAVAPRTVRRGQNALSFKPGPGSPGRVSSKVQEVWMWVRYC